MATLKDILVKFPTYRSGNRWPGLRFTIGFWDYRLCLPYEGATQAEVRGLKGSKARKTYAAIDLASGRVEGGSDELGAALKELYKDPVAFCDAQGKKYRCCCFCGMGISTDESLQAGYGPVCAKRFGLPWAAKETVTI